MPKRKASRQDATSDEDDDLGKLEAELKRREEEIDTWEDTLKQQNEEIGAREDALKQCEEELQKAEEDFSNEAAKAYGATKPDDIITLNVGGTRLQVLRSTLCYVEGSLLASMFSGRWDDNLVKDDQGAFFIDQPYEHFKALLDFFRSCKSAAVNGPPASIADSGDVATNRRFMRMVDFYNCTPEVYPVEIKFDARGGRPKIGQYPNMSVEYHTHPKDGEDDGSAFYLSSIGHSRLVTSASFVLEDHDLIRFGISGDGEIVMFLTFSPNSARNLLYVPSRQSDWNKINLVEMNERCKRPMPNFAGTKAGDTVNFEFDTSSDGVHVRSVKINDHLIFSSADSPGDMFGDKKDDCPEDMFGEQKDDSILDSAYGSFTFTVEGEVFITNLTLN